MSWIKSTTCEPRSDHDPCLRQVQSLCCLLHRFIAKSSCACKMETLYAVPNKGCEFHICLLLVTVIYGCCSFFACCRSERQSRCASRATSNRAHHPRLPCQKLDPCLTVTRDRPSMNQTTACFASGTTRWRHEMWREKLRQRHRQLLNRRREERYRWSRYRKSGPLPPCSTCSRASPHQPRYVSSFLDWNSTHTLHHLFLCTMYAHDCLLQAPARGQPCLARD